MFHECCTADILTEILHLPDTGRIKQTGPHGSVLDITEARLTDAGMYTCTATNTKSSATATAHVIVQGGDIVVEQISDVVYKK